MGTPLMSHCDNAQIGTCGFWVVEEAPMQFVVRNSSLAGIVLGVIGALASSSTYSAQEGSANVRVLDTQIGDSTFYGSWFEGR